MARAEGGGRWDGGCLPGSTLSPGRHRHSSLARTSDAEVAHRSQPMLFSPCAMVTHIPRTSLRADSAEFSSARPECSPARRKDDDNWSVHDGQVFATGVRSERARAPNERDLVTLARQAPDGPACSAARLLSSWRLMGGRSPRRSIGLEWSPMPAFTPPSRGRDRGGDEWSCHDGKFFAAAVLSGEARAPMERQFVASQQRETASSSRRVSRRLWPAERARATRARSASIVAKARSWRPAEAAAKAASDASAVLPAARAAAEAGDLRRPRVARRERAPDLASAALLRACGVGDAGLPARSSRWARPSTAAARGTTALMLASISATRRRRARRSRARRRRPGREGDDRARGRAARPPRRRPRTRRRSARDPADAHGQRAPTPPPPPTPGRAPAAAPSPRSSARSAAAGASPPNGRSTASHFGRHAAAQRRPTPQRGAARRGEGGGGSREGFSRGARRRTKRRAAAPSADVVSHHHEAAHAMWYRDAPADGAARWS